MKKRVVAHQGDFARTFSTEDGQGFRGLHQDIDPVIKHVQKIRDMHQYRDPRKDSIADRHVGSVPGAVLEAWLKKNGHTMHEWAINAGGDPYIKRKGGPGVYDKFLSYFLSRDFSKLHNDHVTTRPETSQFVVPNFIGGKREDEKHTGSSDKGLAKP